MIVAVVVLAACRGGQSDVTASPAAGTVCSPTNGLKKVNITAPGPGGARTSRTYELYVPKHTGDAKKMPLLVSLHGTGASGAIQAAVTHWTTFSDSLATSGGSFVAAFPDGVSSLWLWGAQRSYDVDFVFDVIQDVQAAGCVDASSIYVDGWSEGSYMAQRMACSGGEHGIVFAGVHGYAGGNPDVSGGSCDHSAPTRILLSEGLDDTLIDPQRVGFPALVAWAARYSCASPSKPFNVPQEPAGCAAGSAVAWWPIAGQGHLAWSCAADPTWHDRGVWSYFTQHMAPAETTCS